MYKELETHFVNFELLNTQNKEIMENNTNENRGHSDRNSQDQRNSESGRRDDEARNAIDRSSDSTQNPAQSGSDKSTASDANRYTAESQKAEGKNTWNSDDMGQENLSADADSGSDSDENSFNTPSR